MANEIVKQFNYRYPETVTDALDGGAHVRRISQRELVDAAMDDLYRDLARRFVQEVELGERTQEEVAPFLQAFEMVFPEACPQIKKPSIRVF